MDESTPPRRTSRLLTSTWTRAAALYSVLGLVYAWPLLLRLHSALPSDLGDPGLVTWILWWNAHAVPLTASWWNAPIFFPVQGAFALSETLLGLTPFTTPLQWAGLSAITTYNLSYLLSFPAAAMAAHALAHRLTGRHDAAFLAGLAFGFSPYRADQMPHLQMLWSCWMPLSLLALHRFVEQRRRRDLVLLGVCWLFNGLTTGYYLFFFFVLAVLWVAWFVRTRRDALAIVATFALASLPLLPLLLGYAARQAAFGLSRGIGEADFFGADLAGVWRASVFAWLPSHWTLAPRPEGQLYPGAAIALVAVVGVIAAWRTEAPARRTRTQIGLVALGSIGAAYALLSWAFAGSHVAGVTLVADRPFKVVTIVFWLLTAALVCDRRFLAGWRRRSVLLFYVTAALVMLLFALGPTGRVLDVRFLYKGPYAWLMELPGGHALRVPARFAMLFVLCLGQVAALAFTRLARPRLPTWIVTAIGLAIVLDGWVPRLPTPAAPLPYDLTGLDPAAAVLELPAQDVYTGTAAMIRQTSHGHAIVTGASGYEPPHYVPLLMGLQEADASVVDALRQFGPLIVFVDRAHDVDGHARGFVERLTDVAHIRETRDGTLYSLPALPPGPRHAEAPAPRPAEVPQLQIAAVTAGGTRESWRNMIDDRVDTWWQSSTTQKTGDQIALDFGRVVTVSRLEIDLGIFRASYPRRLGVGIADAGAEAVTIWEGPTAGLAVMGALADPARTPIVIDLPAPARGQRFLLTLLADDPHANWAIAELRAFGR